MQFRYISDRDRVDDDALPRRTRLVEEKWLPDLIGREIPISDNIKPLDMLADDRSKATWANEGLPYA